MNNKINIHVVHLLTGYWNMRFFFQNNITFKNPLLFLSRKVCTVNKCYLKPQTLLMRVKTVLMRVYFAVKLCWPAFSNCTVEKKRKYLIKNLAQKFISVFKLYNNNFFSLSNTKKKIKYDVNWDAFQWWYTSTLV